MTKRYIELCTLFNLFSSILRILSGKETIENIEKLKLIVSLCLSKWRYLNLSMKMINIYWIEDLLLDQIKENNGTGHRIYSSI